MVDSFRPAALQAAAADENGYSFGSTVNFRPPTVVPLQVAAAKETRSRQQLDRGTHMAMCCCCCTESMHVCEVGLMT